MRSLFAALAILLSITGVYAQPNRAQFIVPAPSGPVRVESFGGCAKPTCPAIIILSGTKGFTAPTYDDIGRTFEAAGLSAYLVHVLSTADLEAISAASGARERIAFYARRWPVWTAAARSVIAHLRAQPSPTGKVGILGISLGAEIASAASVGQDDVGALVLVDAGFPTGFPQPVRPLPPLLLIWGSADETFPLSIGQELEKRARKLGGSAFLQIYDGQPHDFFLQSKNPAADVARRTAADFLVAHLSR